MHYQGPKSKEPLEDLRRVPRSGQMPVLGGAQKGEFREVSSHEHTVWTSLPRLAPVNDDE